MVRTLEPEAPSASRHTDRGSKSRSLSHWRLGLGGLLCHTSLLVNRFVVFFPSCLGARPFFLLSPSFLAPRHQGWDITTEIGSLPPLSFLREIGSCGRERDGRDFSPPFSTPPLLAPGGKLDIGRKGEMGGGERLGSCSREEGLRKLNNGTNIKGRGILCVFSKTSKGEKKARLNTKPRC